MRILLTNDDGIDAPGIAAMFDALTEPPALGEVMVIAPRTVQSASSHGITFHEPLMCEEVAASERMRGVAVDGRPADCVKVALRAIWQERFGDGSMPDITISGMNMGANVGINIIYSGTVAAAVESAFLGVPAIAVSLHLGDKKKTRYGRAARIARQVIDRVLKYELDRHSVININVPRTERDDGPLPPVRVVAMNIAPGTDEYERRVSPMGQVYYWVTGSGMEFAHTAPESDVEALLEGCVTVTPLTYNVTDHARLQTWKERFGGGGSA